MTVAYANEDEYFVNEKSYSKQYKPTSRIRQTCNTKPSMFVAQAKTTDVVVSANTWTCEIDEDSNVVLAPDNPEPRGLQSCKISPSNLDVFIGDSLVARLNHFAYSCMLAGNGDVMFMKLVGEM